MRSGEVHVAQLFVRPHRRLRRLCYLHRRSDCYRVERSSSRAGLSSRCGPALFTAHRYGLISPVRVDRGRYGGVRSDELNFISILHQRARSNVTAESTIV
jgi:hypothetical protein